MKSTKVRNFIKALLKFSPVFLLAGLMIAEYDALIASAAGCHLCLYHRGCDGKDQIPGFAERGDEKREQYPDRPFHPHVRLRHGQPLHELRRRRLGRNLALSLGVTGKSVAVVGIICTAILSVATGTSWGTFAACAPIFMWLSHIVDGDPYLTVCAIAGGACFGDNIGLISDTTIVSSGIQGVQVVDRIRHQGVWSIMCLILASIAFLIAGIVMKLPSEAVNGAAVVAEIPDNVWDSA